MLRMYRMANVHRVTDYTCTNDTKTSPMWMWMIFMIHDDAEASRASNVPRSHIYRTALTEIDHNYQCTGRNLLVEDSE